MSRSQDPEKVASPTSAKDWNGPDDPDNPQNWALGKKLYHTVIPGSIGFLWYVGRRRRVQYALCT